MYTISVNTAYIPSPEHNKTSDTTASDPKPDIT